MSTAIAKASGPAIRALQHVCRYDTMRVETYREGECLQDRILVSRFRGAVALRFDDVGYFNRVYATDETVFRHLEDIEEFYRTSPFGCELVAPPSEHRVVERPGWEPATRFAWMHAPDAAALGQTGTDGFSIRTPEPHEGDQFLHTYLRAFDAQEDRIPAAVRNMRHLFSRPELEFLLACRGGRIAGVGILMRSTGSALFCAGGVLPPFREQGCHRALLAARTRLAVASGCRSLYSWAVVGSQSHTNMEAHGLVCAGVTQAWRYLPQRP
jgi:hypothetical protein